MVTVMVYLVKPLPVAHLHDLGAEAVHRRVGAAVLTSGAGVRWSVHVGQERYFLYPQGIDDNVNMDVAAVVVAVRVGADKGLMAGEMLPAKPPAQLLRPVCGQPIVRAVPWVKAADVVVALYVPTLPIFPYSAVSFPTAARSSSLSGETVMMGLNYI